MTRRDMVALGALVLACAAPRAATAAPTISVHDSWSRPASDTAVVYATIVNRGSADELVAASSPTAAKIAFHESMQSSMPMGSMNGMQMGGMLTMKPLARVAIPAHGRRTFAPGGYHLMLTGLRHTLHVGDRFSVRLRFRNAGVVTTIVTVRAT